MENKIEVYFGNEVEGAKEVLNKLGAEQKILELFETQEIEKITSKLSISDMLWIDEYIMRKKLLK